MSPSPALNGPSITIVDEQPDFLVIDKPASIGVHQEGELDGLVTLVCRQTGYPQLWLVHRLDKETSGLLLLAKNAHTAAAFGKLFEQRQVQKFYLALSNRKPKKKQGAVIGDMVKSRDGQWMLTQSKEAPAVSQFFSCGLGDGLRLLLVKPSTGKTHQIRVMAKSLGSPILGDSLYKGERADRMYLHAYALRFELSGQLYSYVQLPTAGQHFIASLCQQSLSQWQTPWQLPWPEVKEQAK
ncbi:TIGR01621 family pseudouridine synthase [Aliiglaciecola sp. CAU 1673]|uniref:TIGR01621 family pseudouridine synthase n=1 Tax=Aliiglaciecola sp. CAU 1673 TaxID=3032595 RepID=UPI0023DA3E4F|nr:TIGR01621 family pseudouridine synthase [Aliiglaciecola sp. CAU 1673]MDF2178031.1 TIGR01621 family pseudouridine synthase [Aliiglaciecola sp. CAU 1673]